MDKPFQPTGSTVLVDGTAREIGVRADALGGAGNNYRVVNLSASLQYFTHGATSSVSSAGAPTGGSPVTNTIGMAGNGVEVFSGLLPWMIASTSTGFLVTPGDGL
jgi:hypothetical protein